MAQGQRIHQLRQPSGTATNGAHHGHIDHGQRPARPLVPTQVVDGSGMNRLPGLDFQRITVQEGREWTEA